MQNTQIINDYKIGAHELLDDLRNWCITSREAHKLQNDAKKMWFEDAENEGITEEEAEKIWEDEIVTILENDPAFM